MDAYWDPVDQLSRRTFPVAPFPARWKQIASTHKLKWRSVPFTKAAKTKIPRKKGIYCFWIGHRRKSIPQVGYPLYVGVAGLPRTQSSTRSLQDRYGDYLREKDREGGRRKVRRMLKAFDGELTFICAVTNISAARLKKMEISFNDALMPYFSSNDFSAEMLHARSAW